MGSLTYTYPTVFQNEIKFWLLFSCNNYSVINFNRTRVGINTSPILKIYLPFTSEPKMSLQHEFSQGTNPVGPVLSLAGLKNTSGGDKAFLERLAAPTAAFYETTFTTDTYRRFSNITEASMTSEARRNFTFKYVFAPKNEEETIEVEGIVNSFKNYSYPKAVDGLPERTYPQNLWTIRASSSVDTVADAYTTTWLGDPLPCVLSSMSVERGDPSDPVLKSLPNGAPAITLLTIGFTEFETGTVQNGVLKSKSEISYDAM